MVEIANKIFELAKKAKTFGEREAYMTCLALIEKKILEDEEINWIQATQTSREVAAMYEKRRDI